MILILLATRAGQSLESVLQHKKVLSNPNRVQLKMDDNQIERTNERQEGLFELRRLTAE